MLAERLILKIRVLFLVVGIFLVNALAGAGPFHLWESWNTPLNSEILPFRERIVLGHEDLSNFRAQGIVHERLDILLSRLADNGPERIILKIQIPLVADEVQTYGPEGPNMYETFANGATADFLQSIAHYRLGENLHDFRAIQEIPYVVLRVDSASLLEVISNEAVTYLATMAFAKPALNESVDFIGANAAHSLGHTGNNKVIAVIDTGVDSSHSMFSGKIVSEACYSQSNVSENWYPICNSGSWGSTISGSGGPCQPGKNCSQGHGSHVAGIALGSSVNPAGTPPSMKGIAYNADLISIMPFTHYYLQYLVNFSFAPQDDITESLMQVYSLRTSFDIASVNLSILLVDESDNYSLTYSSTPCDSDWQDIYDAVALLNSAGIEVIGASGNGGQEASSADKIAAPACLSNVLSVASVAKSSDTFQSYANVAPILDLLAPGGASTIGSSPGVCSYSNMFPDGIWSAYFASSCADAFARLYGTSMAAPHVSGAVALMGSRYPDATRSQRVQWLKASGSSVTFDQDGNSCTSGPNCYTKPRVDVDAAMTAPPGPGSMPMNASTNWECFGLNTVSWNAASSPVTEYEVQGSTSSGFPTSWTYYSDPGTSTAINVQQTTYIRVRACNYVSCGSWVSAGTAHYYSACP